MGCAGMLCFALSACDIRSFCETLLLGSNNVQNSMKVIVKVIGLWHDGVIKWIVHVNMKSLSLTFFENDIDGKNNTGMPRSFNSEA